MIFSESISIRRSAGGTYDDHGHFRAGSRTIVIVDANVQPLQGKELLILPEGKRNKESLKVMTDVELYEVNENIGRLPDIIEWRGKFYEIHSVGYYGKVLPHFESVAININNEKGAD